MKKILFAALLVAAIVGCKRSAEIDVPQETEEGQAIALSSGKVSLSKADGDPVANEGVRVDFMVGDQIGVFAAYVKQPATTTQVPDWSAPDPVYPLGRYFDNAPASCTKAGTSTPSAAPAEFGWGTSGIGGVEFDQLYPKKDRGVYLYAYYPLAHKDSVVIHTTDGPQVSYLLDTLNPLKQPDILWAVGKSKGTGTPATPADTITRKDPLDVLQFEHALSQINFVLYRKDASVSACKLLEIKLRVPASGTVTLTKAAGSNVALTSKDSKATLGTFTVAAGDANIANANVDVWDGTTPGSRPTPVLTLPYMIWPLTAVQAQGCTLSVKLYFGTGDPATDTKNVRTYKIEMTGMGAIAQGKLNLFILGVAPTIITLKGQITAWGTDGNDSNLDIE